MVRHASLVADDLTSTLCRIFAVIWQVTKAHGVENQACTPHVSCEAPSEQADHPAKKMLTVFFAQGMGKYVKTCEIFKRL